MSDYNEFSMLQYSTHDKETQDFSNSCICCLSKSEPVINLANCSHSKFFEYTLENKINWENHFVCIFCHNFLKKTDQFRMQILQNFNMLNNESKYLNNSKTIPSLLKYSKLEINSTFNSQPIEYEIKNSNLNCQLIEFEMKNVTSNSDGDYDLKMELKVESDYEEQIPTTVIIPEANEEKVEKEVKKRKCRTELERKYQGKIRIIMMSMEKMLAERKEEMLKRKYYVDLPYKCESCIVGFNYEIKLTEHMEKKHTIKDNSFICQICKSVLSTQMSFDEHYKRHFRRYECMECGKCYNNIYSTLKHYSECHEKIVNDYKCKICKFTTESHRKYRYHREQHKFSTFTCDQCGKPFHNKQGLRVHIMHIHDHPDRAYSCDQCDKTFKTKCGLKAHMTSHGTPQPSYCVTCDVQFRSEKMLAVHLKNSVKHVKEEDKKFACDECGSKFVTKPSLRDHMDSKHLASTRFPCDKCPKAYNRLRALRKHKAFVHEKKRLPRNKICDHCGRGFTSMAILQSHIRTHTGERPLHCSFCPATFAHSAALYTHKKLLHTIRE